MLRKPRSLMKPTRSEMEYFSVHNESLPFDHTCCLDKSELETCLRFLVSCYRNQKQQSESFFLVPLPPTVQFDVVHQLLHIRLKQHTNFLKQHVLNLHVLVSLASWDSSDSFLLWEPLLPVALHLHRFHFDIFTERFNWFNVIINWSQICVLSFCWTYEGAAMPYSDPGC